MEAKAPYLYGCGLPRYDADEHDSELTYPTSTHRLILPRRQLEDARVRRERQSENAPRSGEDADYEHIKMDGDNRLGGARQGSPPDGPQPHMRLGVRVRQMRWALAAHQLSTLISGRHCAYICCCCKGMYIASAGLPHLRPLHTPQEN